MTHLGDPGLYSAERRAAHRMHTVSRPISRNDRHLRSMASRQVLENAETVMWHDPLDDEN